MQNFNKYLITSAIDEKWGFFVTSVGYSKIEGKQVYPNNTGHPATHAFTWNKGRVFNDYSLVYISGGRGVFESSESASVEISAGTIFILFPGVWHRYKPDPGWGWEEYWVGFRGYYPDHLMSQQFFDKTTPFINIGLNEDMQRMFHKLLDHVKSPVSGYHQIISGITLEMLGLVHSISLNKGLEPGDTSKAISKVKFRMRETIEKPLEIERLLDDIPMSYSKFRQAFKRETGTSPNQYYLNIRLSKAQELLV